MDISVYDGCHPSHKGHTGEDDKTGEFHSHSTEDYETNLRKPLHMAELCNSVKNSRTFVGDSWSLSNNANYLEGKNLSEQNEMLKKCRSRALFTAKMNRVVGDCTLSSLRIKSQLLEGREILCGKKIKERAAHVVFHHVLLNSWRKRQKTLDNIQSENLILSKSVDNLTLQLKVVRLMDTNEKCKLPISEKSVQSLKEEMVQNQNESKRIKSTLDAVNEEKHSLEVSIHEKTRENLKFQSNLEILEIENRILEQDIERMVHNRAVQESDLCDLKLEIVDWKRKVRKSSDEWKKRADSFESESWKTRGLIETKEMSIKEYEKQLKVLEDELVHLEKEKKDLQQKLAGTSYTLEQYIEERTTHRNKLRVIHKKLAETEIQIQLLGESLQKQWNRNNIDRKMMYDYTLKNVRNRRFWGNTLYYVVFPLKAVENLLFGFG